MFAPRLLVGLALALIPLALPATAQTVDTIGQETATHGDVVRVFGTDLVKKSKLVLVQDGAAVKKTKLKVLAVGDTGGEGPGEGPYVDVQIKKGFPGHFFLGVKVKKDIVGISEETLELVTPTPESVEPGAAQPKDLVVVQVRDYGGKGKHVARIGFKKAKIKNVEELDESGLAAVTIQVPKVPNGVWPISIQNGIGTGVLKNALEISGSKAKPSKAATRINFVGKKSFKASKKKIATDEGGGDPGEVNVGSVAGSKKKPKVFGVVMPGQLADLADGDLFSLADGAQILYSETGKGGAMCVWSSAANEKGEELSIQVVAIGEETMTLFVCGVLRLAEEVSNGTCGPELLRFSGMVTAPSNASEDPGGGGECTELTSATGSMTGAFVSELGENIALYGLTPGTLQLSSGTADTGGGFPDQVLSFNVSFDPNSDATPATFNTLNLDGSGLTQFSLQLGTTFWNQSFAPQVPPTPSSMSVTITSVEDVGSNPFGILGCIHGTFTGSLTEASPGMPSQTFSGSFEIPWFDTGF